MLSRRVHFFSVIALAASGVLAVLTSNCHGQANQAAGVEVDADGVLRTKIVQDPTGNLTRQRFNAAKAALDADIVRPSKLRKISLNRLEAAIAKRLEAGQEASVEMRYLAGITKITHVFYYPETKDIVIAGPAEGFFEDIAGRVVGMETATPPLHLEDLVAALRAFSPAGDHTAVIGCSIDPTKEGLKKMQQYLVSVGGQIQPGDAQIIAANLRESLGLQTVTIKGVSSRTHMAQVLVEADYRMKLIGIGLETPKAKIPSYVSKANPSAVARNALQRWYFQPSYDCILVSDDNLAMEMVNSSVELVGEGERVGADGVRVKAGNSDRASQTFCTAFTKEYRNLAGVEPVYAELQNMCDMAIVAAYIQHQDYYKLAGWDMAVLNDEKRFPIEVHEAPQQVETAVNAIWKGNKLMTPIGGGVNIQARQALKAENMKHDEQGAVSEIRKSISTTDIPANVWWWD